MKIFALIHSDNPEVFLTLVTKKVDAVEYANQLMKLNHFQHYSNWCDCHNMDIDDRSWFEYSKNCISAEEWLKFKIINLYYTKYNIMSIFRMFTGCIPLGCSFEQPVEYSYVADKFRDKEVPKDELPLFEKFTETNNYLNKYRGIKNNGNK